MQTDYRRSVYPHGSKYAVHKYNSNLFQMLPRSIPNKWRPPHNGLGAVRGLINGLLIYVVIIEIAITAAIVYHPLRQLLGPLVSKIGGVL